MDDNFAPSVGKNEDNKDNLKFLGQESRHVFVFILCLLFVIVYQGKFLGKHFPAPCEISSNAHMCQPGMAAALSEAPPQ